MSPSRIPRPGGAGPPSPSPTTSTTTSPIVGLRTTAAPGSPALGTIIHHNATKANNPFAQLHNKQLTLGSHAPGSPTVSNPNTNPAVLGSPTISSAAANKLAAMSAGSHTPSLNTSTAAGAATGTTSTGTVRRRPKPPLPGDEDQTLLASVNPLNPSQRRVPTGMRTASGPVPATAGGAGGAVHRSILRQPSTPSFPSTAYAYANISGGRTNSTNPYGAHSAPPLGVMRARAASTTAGKAQQPTILPGTTNNANNNDIKKTITGAGGMRSLPSQPQHLFEPSFAEHREPAVPPHIRVRLRLIHQLGVVLGMDAAAISGSMDIPGLLARVDAAYEREHTRFAEGELPIAIAAGEDGGASALPLPLSASRAAGGGAGPAKSGGGGGGGVFGMFRRLGRKTAEEVVQTVPPPPEGPAFGVPLSEAPGGSWCTSLIGGQRHELPLVVFTVVEEIYRRGMSQPGIFRLAGDGARISSLSKVFNLPPLYGDSLPISTEPIHNLTGLVKRYVRDLPEPLLDESLFEAFLAFCVAGGEADVDADTDRDQLERQDTEANLRSVIHERMGESASNHNVNDNESDSAPETKDDSIPLPLPVPHAAVPIGHAQRASTRHPLSTRIHAAKILLKLLPPLHFSLFIYLLAFLGQLPLFPDNRLNVESISIIFGPAMCAARGRGISGLGNKSSSSVFASSGFDGAGAGTGIGRGEGERGGPGGGGENSISDLVERSQAILAWLLKNWAAISEKVLDLEEDLPPTPPLGSISTLSTSKSSSTTYGEGMTVAGGESKGKKKKSPGPGQEVATTIDPRLLSPIDLRGSDRVRKAEAHGLGKLPTTTTAAGSVPSGAVAVPAAVPAAVGPNIIHGNSTIERSTPDEGYSPSYSDTSHSSENTPPLSYSSTASPSSALPTPTTTSTSTSSSITGQGVQILRASASSGALRSTTSSTSGSGGGSGLKSSSSTSFSFSNASGSGGGGGMKTSSSSGGLFARAFSSMSISSQAQTHDDRDRDRDRDRPTLSRQGNNSGTGDKEGKEPQPKRSASFNSLSSLVRKVGSSSGSGSGGGAGRAAGNSNASRTSLVERDSSSSNSITSVLGSLHDLLVSKDKQIERDARELALLRHTLLEMDDKLQKATRASPLPGPVGLNGLNGVPAQSTTLQQRQHEIDDLHSQLSTALAALDTLRLSSRRQQDRVAHLESVELKRRAEISKLEVALALERARSEGLVEERDLARERLDKVKTTLFSVA